MGAINYDLKKIKAVLLDIDGVISPESVQIGRDGNPLRQVNVKDGYAIQLASRHGIKVIIISGGYCEGMASRLVSLGVSEVIMHASVKETYLSGILEKYDLNADEVAYMGDDIPDYKIMQLCGLSCCPSDAANDILAVAGYVSRRAGGHGCVRDLLEQILRAKGLWMTDEAFAW